MKTIYKYWKNSNTGQLLMSQEFKETRLEFPVMYYDINKQKFGENLALKGFVEIKEKTFRKHAKQDTKSTQTTTGSRKNF